MTHDMAASVNDERIQRQQRLNLLEQQWPLLALRDQASRGRVQNQERARDLCRQRRDPRVLGVGLLGVEMRQPALARAVPIAVGAVVLIAGAFQLTAWKARRLAGHDELAGRSGPRLGDAEAAWRHGVRLGVDCARCCAGLMAVPLVVGIMDLRVMAAVTVAITAERLAPDGMRVARGIGVVAVGAGLFLIVRAAGLE